GDRQGLRCGPAPIREARRVRLTWPLPLDLRWRKEPAPRRAGDIADVVLLLAQHFYFLLDGVLQALESRGRPGRRRLGDGGECLLGSKLRRAGELFLRLIQVQNRTGRTVDGALVGLPRDSPGVEQLA